MPKKGKHENNHNDDDNTNFILFLRALLRNTDVAKDAFKHDMSPARKRFLAYLHGLFRKNGNKKEGDR